MSRSAHDAGIARASILAAIIASSTGCSQQPKQEPSRPLYVANDRTNTVSAYSINGDSGSLTPVPGSPFSAGQQPSTAVVDVSGKFAYVTNTASGDIAAYGIDGSSGALTKLAGSPIAADYRPHGIAIDPSSRFVYVANENLKVSAYTIEAETGLLKPVVGSPFATGTSSFAFATAPSLSVDASGKFAYVLDDEHAGVYAYTINRATGALAPVQGSPFTVGTHARAMALDPKAHFLYVVDAEYGKISTYAINSGSGALSAAASSSIGWSDGPESVAVDPAGKFAYVAGTDKVSAYAIDASNGALKPVAGSPFAAGYLPGRVEVAPSGKFVYVVNNDSKTISAYAANADTGALTIVAGSPFQNPAAVENDPFAVWFNGGKCAALNHLYRSREPDGTLRDAYSIGRMPSESKIPAANHEEHLDAPIPRRLNTTHQPAWYYFYDPKAGIAFRHTGGDSDVTVTIRRASNAPPGVPHADLSAARTTSGLTLGASGASVIAKLGEPYIVKNCGLELYIYLQSRVGEPNELEFTIQDGRVAEIFSTSYG